MAGTRAVAAQATDSPAPTRPARASKAPGAPPVAAKGATSCGKRLASGPPVASATWVEVRLYQAALSNTVSRADGIGSAEHADHEGFERVIGSLGRRQQSVGGVGREQRPG